METLFYSVSIGFAYILYKGYKIFQVPEELEHIPNISLISSIFAVLKKQPFDEQFDLIHKPPLSHMGLARIWMRGNWEIVVSDHKLAREILGNSDVFRKQKIGGNSFSKKLLAFKFFGGSNIVNTDGDAWRRHRKVANPAFKKTWDTSMFGECTIELIDKILSFGQESIDIRTLFQQLTLDALGRGMFTYDFEAVKKGESSHYLKIYNNIASAIFNPLYLILPFLEDWVPSRKVHHSEIIEFRGFLFNIIKERQEEIKKGINHQDLLSLIIKASSEETDEKLKLTDEEVLNDLVAFFLAGHDTTANTLTSTFYYLAKHPEIQDKAYQEIKKILESSETIIPSHEQLKSMVYIDCIIKESMRIITTASQMRRCCTARTSLSNGLILPENTFVSIHFWGIHRDPRIFEFPDTFNPDRFLDLTGIQNQTWMAFGAGSRMCPGLKFSLIEQRVVMVMLLVKFNIVLGSKSTQISKPKISSIGMAHPEDIDICFIPRF